MSAPSTIPTTLVDLPDDILAELFMVLADVDLPRGHYPPRLFEGPGHRRPSLGWIKLTHVCRRLRYVGIDQAILWGRVVSIFPRARETTFARSRDAPLDLCLTGEENGVKAYSLWPISTDAILSRTRHMQDVVYLDQPDARSWWIDASLPWLRVLQLEFKDHVDESNRDPTPLLKLGQINAPALRYYETYGGFVSFHAASLRCLTIGHQVVWTTLLDSLRTCPLLETLIVKDTREPIGATSTATEPVHLMHLTTFRLTMPSSMSVLKLVKAMDIPTSIRPQIQNCTSLGLFRHLVQHFSDPMYDILTISAERVTGTFVHAAVNVSKRVHAASFPAYRARPDTGITTVHTYFSFTNMLSHLLGAGFTPAVAGGFDTLVFHTSDTPSPLSTSKVSLRQIGDRLRPFSGVTSLYVQLESAPILLAVRDSAEISEEAMLFPALNTVVLDVSNDSLRVSVWNGIVDLILYRKGYRRPLGRFVLMGSRLCHLSPEAGDVSKTLEMIDLRPIEGLVGEVVDLRDTRKCTCGAS